MITINVNQVNDPPITENDSYTAVVNQPLDVTAVFNTALGRYLTATVVAGSAVNGAATVVSPGIAVTYTPNPDLFGADSFIYTVTNGHGGSATATVNVTVAPVNDPPRFVAGGNRRVLEDAGAQTVANWATSISAAPRTRPARRWTSSSPTTIRRSSPCSRRSAPMGR